MTRALLMSLVLVACSSGKTPSPPPPSPPPEPEVAMKKPPAPPASPTCTTADEIRAKLGEVCTVIGTYDLREINNKKGGAWRNWPVVKLDGDKFIALESVWDDSKMPAADEVAKWRGKKVAVTGTVLGSPPSKNPANMSMLTMAPVESIALAK